VSRHDQEFDFSTPPFNLLSAEQAREVGTAMDIEFVPKGTAILEAGSASRAVYVIMKGAVTAYEPGDVHDRVFAEFGPHDIFGTTASLTGQARYSYEADEDTLVWTIPAEKFRSVVGSSSPSPSAAWRWTRSRAARISAR